MTRAASDRSSPARAATFSALRTNPSHAPLFHWSCDASQLWHGISGGWVTAAAGRAATGSPRSSGLEAPLGMPSPRSGTAPRYESYEWFSIIRTTT